MLQQLLTHRDPRAAGLGCAAKSPTFRQWRTLATFYGSIGSQDTQAPHWGAQKERKKKSFASSAHEVARPVSLKGQSGSNATTAAHATLRRPSCNREVIQESFASEAMQRGESMYKETAGTCIKTGCNPQPRPETDLTRRVSYTPEPFHLFTRSRKSPFRCHSSCPSWS